MWRIGWFVGGWRIDDGGLMEGWMGGGWRIDVWWLDGDRWMGVRMDG